jgi:DNA helicase-2/ATP-dependent DNA helicase PcrA
MEFNKQQQEAINSKDGAFAVIASAGSGKSTVLVNRIKNLIENFNVDESDILAISFTRNTANDLKSKLNKMGFYNVNTGTFHSICANILTNEGYDISKELYEWQRDKCFKDINSKVDAKDVSSFIGYQKNYLKTYTDEFVCKDSKYSEEELRKYFKEYEQLKIKNNAYDYEDWLIMCHELLKVKPYHFKYILVDEHQDSNLVQNLLLHQWCESGNIFCVFDYRQAIYTFRGGNPEYCMNFDKEWQNAKIINLDVNYRSCYDIVKNANNFIKKYYGNYKYYSDSIANSKNSATIDSFSYTSRNEEGIDIVNKVENLIKNNVNPNDIAILYRLNSHSNYIEGELRNRKIPYYISNESSFSKRKEVDGIMSFLRLVENPHDDGAFENIFKLHTYPIKFFTEKQDLNEIKKFAGLHNLSYYESLVSMKFDKDWKNKSVKTFEDSITKIRLQKDKKLSIESLIDNIYKVFQFDEYLSEKYTDEEDFEDRKNSIQVLKSFIRNETLSKFINFVYGTNNKRKATDGVKLMTVHASKGLEFKYVFVIGIEDGKFPHEKSDLIDEARLFYVAVTRSKENLYLSQIYDDNRFVNEYIN